MNTINIHMSHSKVYSNFDAMVIRLGLLISDNTHSIGDLHVGIVVEDSFNKDRSANEKLEYIRLHIINYPDHLGIPMEEFENTKATYKYLKNIKFKSPDEIKHLKSIEKMINIAFTDRNNFFSHAYAEAGLPQLSKFINHQLYIHAVHPTQPEERFNEWYHLMSEELLDRFNTKTLDDIFMVTGNFSEYLEENQIEIGELGNNTNTNAEVLRAENMFVLPSLVVLSANEIDIVRDHLLGTSEVFRTNMMNWNKDLITTIFEENNFESMSQKFTTEIEPYTKLLQTEMDKNDRLALVKATTGNSIIFKVNMYVTSVGFYWDYLHFINNVTDETMTVLENYPNYENLKNTSCIIIEGHLLSLDSENEIIITKGKTAIAPVHELTKRKTRDI